MDIAKDPHTSSGKIGFLMCDSEDKGGTHIASLLMEALRIFSEEQEQ